MKINSIPNRTISDKGKSAKNKTVVDKIKSVRFDVDSQQRINESSGSISAKFQYDDDFDNWFPWEC
jgi:hypothetical protein